MAIKLVINGSAASYVNGSPEGISLFGSRRYRNRVQLLITARSGFVERDYRPAPRLFARSSIFFHSPEFFLARIEGRVVSKFE